ncbi:MAG: S-adenosylmethionine:tRNA ribosyltransferase-isomerase [Muribaculaceae bacterium]|nr:S-adenosylmethionine:tRNA ribosyltransferase-isomerase [Muribaculaceae bacterium]
MIQDIKIADFDYPLPDERIATHPLSRRDSCRLLLSRPDGRLSHRRFSELPNLLPPSPLIVCNNTRVINARMAFYKSSGARIEVFLLEPLDPSDYVLAFQCRRRCVWKCMIGNLKRWKEGQLLMNLTVEGREFQLSAKRLETLDGNAHAVEFTWNDDEVTFASVVDVAGRIPIPPYLRRESEDADTDDYQTVYSEIKGSVAAPTAGLHFTDDVFDSLRGHNADIRYLTLHVGAGTFQPVKSDTIGGHPMHTETFTVERSLIEALLDAITLHRPVVAVGTTSVRTLESLPYLGAAVMNGRDELKVSQWEAYDGTFAGFDTVTSLQALLTYMDKRQLNSLTASTAIMIAPGFRWRLVDVLVTNFHQPQSTLLLLVSAFLDRNSSSSGTQWRHIYNEALKNDYRFLSYGDACLLFPKTGLS